MNTTTGLSYKLYHYERQEEIRVLVSISTDPLE